MKNLFHKNLVLIIMFVCALGYAQAQTTYTLNGSLGVDTIPEHTLDVNGDGHFKGELLLDDDLRMMKLASGDIMIQRLVYIDEDGRMHRLGEDGARDIEEHMHNLDCRYVDVGGAPMPVVYWNTGPGKITAHDEVCGAPNVGIGTHNPEARLDVRGTGYFQKELGIGAVNDQTEARLLVRTNSSLPGMLLRSNQLIDGTLTDVELFKVESGGKVEQNVYEINSDRAFRLRNLAFQGNQELFNVRNNGRIQLKFIGDNEHLNVFRIERGNAPQVDDHSHILAVRGTGRTQINFTGQPHQTAFGIKGGDDSSSDYLFHVKGDGHISAAAVHVRELGNFPDYVFEPGYELMPLEKLRRFIADNQRLPNMPSAEEVERSGVDLGEMNRLLVEKVEELTLYVLKLEERLKAVEAK